MNRNSLTYSYEHLQVLDTSPRNGEVIQFRGNEVYCPMCEIWHLNNTLCQQGSY